jgi:hypothetical protein
MGKSMFLKRPINSRGNIMIGKEPSDYVEKIKYAGFTLAKWHLELIENIDHLTLLGPAPAGTGTSIAFDPTFGSFTLLELISH